MRVATRSTAPPTALDRPVRKRDVNNATPVAHLQHALGNRGVQRMARGVPSLQRAIEITPPGRGEASAFGRVDELLAILNRLSNGEVIYTLDPGTRLLQAREVAGGTPTPFDRRMLDFIRRAASVRLRLITRHALINRNVIEVDDFQEGYVDLDDLLAGDDAGFQSSLVHLLAERFAVPRYTHLIGTSALDLNTPAGGRLFDRAHAIGRVAQAELLQAVLNDNSIHFVRDDDNGVRVHRIFRSTDHRYRVIMIMRGLGQPLTRVTMEVHTADGRTLTVEDFAAERAAAAAPAGP